MTRAIHQIKTVVSTSASLYRELALSAAQLLPRRR